jgi:hypothetical protein
MYNVFNANPRVKLVDEMIRDIEDEIKNRKDYRIVNNLPGDAGHNFYLKNVLPQRIDVLKEIKSEIQEERKRQTRAISSKTINWGAPSRTFDIGDSKGDLTVAQSMKLQNWKKNKKKAARTPTKSTKKSSDQMKKASKSYIEFVPKKKKFKLNPKARTYYEMPKFKSSLKANAEEFYPPSMRNQPTVQQPSMQPMQFTQPQLTFQQPMFQPMQYQQPTVFVPQPQPYPYMYYDPATGLYYPRQ